jgi:hypothetical protein
MATQITVLKTNTQSDGSFSVSGVFWLAANANNIIPAPMFVSKVPSVPSDIACMLQCGTLVEIPFETGLFNPTTPISSVQSFVQNMYAREQSAIASASYISGLVGSSFDGSTWSQGASSLASVKVCTQFTQRFHCWQDWKRAQSKKNGIHQHSEDSSCYKVWFYDGPEVHLCTIWKGEVPAGIASMYSQAQNDADKVDFVNNYLYDSNNVIELKTSDGRPNVAPNSFPPWVNLYFTGRGDDCANEIVGNGPFFTGSLNSFGDSTVTWKFLDIIYLLGGIVCYSNAQVGDTLHYYVSATGTVTGSGTQNVVLSNVGPGNIILPVTGSGQTTIDLASAVPVPNHDYNGFWDLAIDKVGSGTIFPNYNQTGTYDLYDFDVPLGNLINSVPIVGTDRTINLLVESVTSMMILPQWTHIATIHNCGHPGLQVGWTIAAARSRTV